jgi:hypothetical protein
LTGSRAELASVEPMQHYLDLGVRHFSIGVDQKILFEFWKSNGEKLRKVMSQL